MSIEEVIATFCQAADIIISEGANYARRDDPHAFGAVARGFDDGRAAFRLVLELLPAGRRRIALQLTGTQGGQERALELFSTLVQGPVDESSH